MTLAVLEKLYPNGTPYLELSVSKIVIGSVTRVDGGYLIPNKRKPVASLDEAAKQCLDNKMNACMKEHAMWSKLLQQIDSKQSDISNVKEIDLTVLCYAQGESEITMTPNELTTTELVIDYCGYPFRVDMLPYFDEPNPEQFEVLMPNDQRITLTGGCEVDSYQGSRSTCFYYDPSKTEQMPKGYYQFCLGFQEAYLLELKNREAQGRKTARFKKRAWHIGMEYFWDFESAEEAMEQGWQKILSDLK